jgi:hypothetical protein
VLAAMTEPFRFEVALSYATEDRPFVRAVAEALKRHGVPLFYDQYEGVDLWGRDLAVYFDEVYRKQSRYVVVFASANYLAKVWPKRELQSALAGAIMQEREFILPARLDDTELPGLPPTIGSINCQNRTPDEVAEMIIDKVGAARSRADASTATVRVPARRTSGEDHGAPISVQVNGGGNNIFTAPVKVNGDIVAGGKTTGPPEAPADPSY